MPGLRMRTSDPDRAAAAGGDVYFPHRLDVRHDRSRFGMSLSAVTLGPVSAGVLGYSGEVQLSTGELDTGYQVNVPLTGVLHTWIGGTGIEATPAVAAVYPPDRPARLRGWAEGGGLLGLKIDRVALERRAGRDGTVVALAPSLRLDRGPGRQWWSLARTVLELIDDPDGPLSRPIVARPLADALVGALIEAAGAPPGPCAPAPPGTVRRAVDLIEAAPELPWTVPEIAGRAGVSVRGLQDGFARHLGVGPAGYLRRVRLDRARAELLAADPDRETVAAVAARWGFPHAGRFAARYRDRHGRAPSQDLRVPDRGGA